MSFGRMILIGLLGLVVAEATVFLLIEKPIGTCGPLSALMVISILGGSFTDPARFSHRSGGFLSLQPRIAAILVRPPRPVLATARTRRVSMPRE
jgi:hypothetical protein